jgi:2'-5' RNA ligase
LTTEAASARLFIALWPTPALRRALAAEQRRWQWPAGAALTAADKLHLTLHFIGAVPAARVAAVAEGLRLPCPRFTLVLDHAEVWPNRCAVLGASDVPAPLAALHGALADALRALQLPVEPRALRPHVTLARKARGAVAPAQPFELRWPVRGYALMQSAAGRYTPIARYG